MELIIRAICTVSGGGEEGGGRGYREGVVRMEITKSHRESSQYVDADGSVCGGRGQGVEMQWALQGERAVSTDPCWGGSPGPAWLDVVRGRRNTGCLAGTRTQSYLMVSKELSFIL